LLFVHLGRGTVRPAALAREADVSRQAVHKLLGGLQAQGLISRAPDPDDARSQVVELTDRGRAFLADASAILIDLEAELAERIGEDHVTALRQALAHDTGPPPTDGTVDASQPGTATQPGGASQPPQTDEPPQTASR
jgi:DNA-binding MarR family transcriptional regulator